MLRWRYLGSIWSFWWSWNFKTCVDTTHKRFVRMARWGINRPSPIYANKIKLQIISRKSSCCGKGGNYTISVCQKHLERSVLELTATRLAPPSSCHLHCETPKWFRWWTATFRKRILRPGRMMIWCTYGVTVNRNTKILNNYAYK